VKILHIASEAVPWVKTGGLADVVGALCGNLAAAGHHVTLALPLYRAVREAGFDPGTTVAEVRLEGRRVGLRTVETTDGWRVVFVDAPDLFDREGLYGTGGTDHPDNLTRFSVFVRSVLRMAVAFDLHPDVVHCHDWQTALAPLYARDGWLTPDDDAPRSTPPIVLTVHNLAYQGTFPSSVVASAGLPRSGRDSVVTRRGVNVLRGGLIAADRVTTVSPRYAFEITRPAHGCGLHDVIAGLEPPVAGILNGIDTEVWDPASDPTIAAPYDASDLTGKVACKADLQEALGLPAEPEVPLFGMVSRLVDQKGLGLIADLGDDLVQRRAQFAFLGTGEIRHERYLFDLDERHPNVATRLTFSEELAHRIEAGADFFLMPSEYEPCGLNQMISQRYGTPPIVHRVGGLADSVTHASPEALRAGRATGVVFERHDAPTLSWAVDFALDMYADPSVLAAVRHAGMERDFSWARSGRQYETLYLDAVETRTREA
jgi:starch synthase